MSGLKVIRYGAWAAVAAFALFAGVLVYQQLSTSETAETLLDPVSAIGGPYEMLDGDGQLITEKTFLGKPSLYYFGFTFCPDVCPTTLSEMQGWITALGEDADRLNYIFISVDPERDTPDVMKDYVSAFDERIKVLTGSAEQVKAMLKSYRIYAKKVPLDDGGYTMDHSAAVYLMDANNRFVGTIAYGEDEAVAMKKLRRLVENAPAN